MRYDMFLLLLILIFTDKTEMSFIFTNIAFVVNKVCFYLPVFWTPCYDASGLKRLFDSFVFFIIQISGDSVV